MPIDPTAYPPDWPEISARIRERDGNRCRDCGVAQGARGYRDRWGNFIEVGQGAAPAGVKIIVIRLTVSHQHGADTRTASDDELRTRCQRCHLRYDRELHGRNASLTRRATRRRSGQLEMNLEQPSGLPFSERGRS